MSSARLPARPRDASPADSSVLPTASASSAALRRAVVALAHAQESSVADFDGADHWPPDAPPAGPSESRERLAHTGERQIWMAHDSARAAVAREVSAYARVLRDGGMRARQVVATVAAVFRDAAAPTLADHPLDVAVHDAGRHAVEAYFAR